MSVFEPDMGTGTWAGWSARLPAMSAAEPRLRRLVRSKRAVMTFAAIIPIIETAERKTATTATSGQAPSVLYPTSTTDRTLVVGVERKTRRLPKP